MRVELYGYSDDLIYARIDGTSIHEIGAYIGGEGRYSKALEIRSIGGARGIRAHAIYDGCWSFSAGQLDEGRSIPDGWSVAVQQGHAYSTRLVVDTGAELVEVTREGGKPITEEER